MYTNIALFALAAAPLVAAHGKIAEVQGDMGGNGTAMGIQGGIIPGAGRNDQTEPDTTVFWSKDIKTDDDIGFTEGGNGNNELSMVKDTMAMSGNTLPQVSNSVKGTFHVVTADGAGPLQAMVDGTGSAKWSQSSEAKVTKQVPGNNGNYEGGDSKRSLFGRMLENMGLLKRADYNVNKKYPFEVQVPAGTTCTGSMAGQKNVCLMKISNNNDAGPFGGVFAFQMGSNSTSKRAVNMRSPVMRFDA